MTKIRKNSEQDQKIAEELLKKPYKFIVVADEDGFFHAEVAEFPGCVAVGETRKEALENLSEIAESWILSMLANGQDIPEPSTEHRFSGKLVLRMPRSLHKKAADAAESDGVSLNQFIVTCVAESIGFRSGFQGKIRKDSVLIISHSDERQTKSASTSDHPKGDLFKNRIYQVLSMKTGDSHA